jgi:hypothetical protein
VVAADLPAIPYSNAPSYQRETHTYEYSRLIMEADERKYTAIGGAKSASINVNNCNLTERYCADRLSIADLMTADAHPTATR